MMYPHPIIAKEGWPYLALVGALTLLVHYLGGIAWSWPVWIIASGVLQIVRQVRVGKPTGSFIGMQLGHIGITSISLLNGATLHKQVGATCLRCKQAHRLSRLPSLA